MDESGLGLGVLGLGEGRSIISAGVRSSMWKVVGLCDLNDKLGHERCHEFGLPPTLFTPDMDELLTNPGVDVVGIYTPDQLHADHVIRSLKAGKHVICTKPFIDNLGQAAELLQTVEETGKRVMVGQSTRFFRPFSRQREHFDECRFGHVGSVEAYYNADHRWFLAKEWARSNAFKWLYGGLSHPVDLVRWYLPEIEEVMGYSRLSENGARLGLVHDDTFHFILRAKGGEIARVSGCYSSPVSPNSRDSNMSCILRGEKGASQADYYNLRYAWKTDDQSVVETFEDEDDHYFRFDGHSHHAGEYQNYIEYFARCLGEGSAPLPDDREGIVTVAVMQAMEESVSNGAPVRVRELLSRYGLESLMEPVVPAASRALAG